VRDWLRINSSIANADMQIYRGPNIANADREREHRDTQMDGQT